MLAQEAQHCRNENYMQFNQESEIRSIVKNPESFKEKLRNNAKVNDLILLSKFVNEVLYELRPRKGAKYGRLGRGMKKELVFEFFYALPKKKQVIAEHLVLFMFALRNGERKSIKPDYKENIISLFNEKGDRIDYLPMHGKTRELMEYYDSIPKKYCNKMICDTFKDAMRKINREKIYAIDTIGRNQRLYTPHSFRHTGLNNFQRTTKDPLKKLAFGRWVKGAVFGVMEIYETYELDDMRIDLEATYEPFYELIDYCLTQP